jgi:hypothetical protein
MGKREVKDIWQTTDYKKRPVSFTEERKRHIDKGRVFDDTSNWPTAIKKTVEDPEIVVEGDYPEQEILCRRDAGDETTKGKWMNVPVTYQLGRGDVRTAILADKPKRSDNKVIYIKPGFFK